MTDSLGEWRARIDEIDGDILALLNQRAHAAREIGRLKSGAIYRPEREAQVLRRVQEANPGPLSGDRVGFLFREIMSACLALERPLSVAYLGPAGTYSEAAAWRQFGHAAETVPCASLDEVFREAQAGHTDFAVVPVENSSEGAVGRTMDLMIQTPLRVCGEVLLRVRHQLLVSPASTGLAAVRRVYAHAQALAQCQHWLGCHLADAERVPVASNGDAARRALEDPEAAAIAGQNAAERFALTVAAADIEDEATNTTRFLVLGSHDAEASGQDRTSLVLAAHNRPGAIHALLTPLARHGVSMSRLESRPSRTGLWEYLFFVDVEGHQQDPAVATALGEIREEAVFMKILGSYPVAAL